MYLVYSGQTVRRVLGEPFTAWIAMGTALVMAGVWPLARYRIRSDS